MRYKVGDSVTLRKNNGGTRLKKYIGDRFLVLKEETIASVLGYHIISTVQGCDNDGDEEFLQLWVAEYGLEKWIGIVVEELEWSIVTPNPKIPRINRLLDMITNKYDDELDCYWNAGGFIFAQFPSRYVYIGLYNSSDWRTTGKRHESDVPISLKRYVAWYGDPRDLHVV